MKHSPRLHIPRNLDLQQAKLISFSFRQKFPDSRFTCAMVRFGTTGETADTLLEEIDFVLLDPDLPLIDVRDLLDLRAYVNSRSSIWARVGYTLTTSLR